MTDEREWWITRLAVAISSRLFIDIHSLLRVFKGHKIIIPKTAIHSQTWVHIRAK